MPNPYTGENYFYEKDQPTSQRGAVPAPEGQSVPSAEDMNKTIAKYSKGNPEYEATLKKHVANYLGYENFKKSGGGVPPTSEPSKEALKRMGGGEATNYLRGDITPGGVRSLVGAGIDYRNLEQSLKEKEAKARAAGSADMSEVFANLSGFEEKDALDKAIKGYLGNPRDEDGTFKSIEELERELVGAVTGGDAQWTEEEAKQRINQRIPDALREDWQENYYKSLGYTNTQAEDLVKYDRYVKGEMSESEAELYRITDPTFAGKAEAMKSMPGLTKEMNQLKTGSPDSLTFIELRQKYPNVTPELVKEDYMTAAKEDIQAILADNQFNLISTDPETGEVIVPPLPSFMGSEVVKDVKTSLSSMYQGALTTPEIDNLLYQYYRQQIQQINQ
jgi:hypothetical protein